MRRLFLAVSALSLVSLAACGRHGASSDSSADEGAPRQQPAATQAPPPRPITQASAVTRGDAEGGAYGMPRAPVPYNELGAYERRQDQGARQDPSASVQPEPTPAPSRTQMSSKPRSADTVFY